MHSYSLLIVGNIQMCICLDDNLIQKHYGEESDMMVDVFTHPNVSASTTQPNRLLCPHPAIFCRSYLQEVWMSLKTEKIEIIQLYKKNKNSRCSQTHQVFHRNSRSYRQNLYKNTIASLAVSLSW